MKVALSVAVLALLFASCQKDLSKKESPLAATTVSSDALTPMPCHSISFVTDYPIIPGEVPPFRFTKTLYPDTRVKTINMLSRANPIYASFKPQAWELIGTFTYTTNTAFFNGTKELWEYYKTSTGATARKSIVKKNVSLQFNFFHDQPGAEGYQSGTCSTVQNLLTNKLALQTFSFPDITVGEGSDEPAQEFTVDNHDPSLLVFESHPAQLINKKKITFNYKAGSGQTRRNISYQPTQNWISLEYTILEVMQWVPTSFRTSTERAGVSVEFYPTNTSAKVVQSQVYTNQQYDSRGNMTSFSYGNNIPQRTTWSCSN